MAEPAVEKKMNLLERISEYQTFHTSVFFTYGADLAFFEEAVLHPLWRNGCRNNLVFLDAKRYADTTQDWGASLTWVGRRYILTPVELGGWQSFHPKLILLLGRERARLLIGSGNLTFTGYGQNHEVFTCLDWTTEEREFQYLFAEVWDMTQEVFERWGHSAEAESMLRKARYVCDWLAVPSEQRSDRAHLLHTLDSSLLDQCRAILRNHAIKSLTILAPFFDQEAHALNMLYSEFEPEKVNLILQDKSVVGKLQAFERLKQAGAPLELYQFKDSERYLHAKLYIFESEMVSFAFMGSANCTRAAWLHPCTKGNMETGLMLRDSPGHFQPLIEPYYSGKAVHSYEEIEFREADPLPNKDTDGSSIRLMDISIEDDMLEAKYQIGSLPPEVGALELRFATTPPRFIPLETIDEDSGTLQQPMSPDLEKLLRRPLSACICGIQNDGEHSNLCSNEVWITNVDVMRRERSRALPDYQRAGQLLAEKTLDDSEWGDLYASLSDLIELDVAGLKRRGGSYTAVPREKSTSSRRPNKLDKQLEVILETTEERENLPDEEIAKALYQESYLPVLLQYIRGRLPGLATQESDVESGDLDETSSSSKSHRRRAKRLSRNTGRRFLNLVKKYIRSLANVEYMKTISIHHILAYYVVFQRITWLLWQHEVTDVAEHTNLANQINQEFFGMAGDPAPALSPRHRRHIRRIWEEEWLESGAVLHALVSTTLIWQYSEGLEDSDEQREIQNQVKRVLCGLAVAVGLLNLFDETGWADCVDDIYGQPMLRILETSKALVRDHLGEMRTTLLSWTGDVNQVLNTSNEENEQLYLSRMKVDYLTARYKIAERRDDVQSQLKLCRYLIHTLGSIHEYDGCRDWTLQCASIFVKTSQFDEVVRSLIELGNILRRGGEYDRAADRFEDAKRWAERSGNEDLASKADRKSKNARFFLKEQNS